MHITYKQIFEEGYVKEISNKLDLNYSEFNSSEDSRINVATSIAAISRGKDSANNPFKRFGRLLLEAAPNIPLEEILSKPVKCENKAGRPMEYVPVILNAVLSRKIVGDEYTTMYLLSSTDIEDFTEPIEVTLDTFMNDIMPFSYLEKNILYTNLRALINAGILYEDIPYTEVFNYRAVEVKAPYFVFAQIRTHSRLSQVAVSERVVTENEYWLPEDIISRIKDKLDNSFIDINNLDCIGCENCKYGKRLLNSRILEDVVDIFLDLSPKKVRAILKHLGYHKEIYDRWPNHLKYKTWIMGGYTNDPKAWGHFLLEREVFPDICNSWVQTETKITASAIGEVIMGDID